MCKRENRFIAVTGAWEPGVKEREVPKEKLMPGEVSAAISQVGCYFVRSAWKVPGHSGSLKTHEISARHVSALDKAFTYVCCASEYEEEDWHEYIGDIFAVKEGEAVPDDEASLLVYVCHAGRISNYDIWYQLSPDGETAVYDSMRYRQ